MTARQIQQLPSVTELGFFDLRPRGCMLTDLAGVISDPTRSAARMLGCRLKDLEGRSLSDFVVRSERPAFQNAIKNIARFCEATRMRASLERSDGAIAVATFAVSVATDENDRPAVLVWNVEAHRVVVRFNLTVQSR
jgi:PAS domain S-box-containing protein